MEGSICEAEDIDAWAWDGDSGAGKGVDGIYLWGIEDGRDGGSWEFGGGTGKFGMALGTVGGKVVGTGLGFGWLDTVLNDWFAWGVVACGWEYPGLVLEEDFACIIGKITLAILAMEIEGVACFNACIGVFWIGYHLMGG